MASVIEKVQRPALILAHNKTLAAQLYQEFKSFFPEQCRRVLCLLLRLLPARSLHRAHRYLHRKGSRHQRPDRPDAPLRHALLHRASDVIIVSSVSCIYGLGLPEYYSQMQLHLAVNQKCRRDDILLHLVEMHYKRGDFELIRATFRARGDVLEVMPAYEEALAYRIEFFGDEIERISAIDPLTGKVKKAPGEDHHLPRFPPRHSRTCPFRCDRDHP